MYVTDKQKQMIRAVLKFANLKQIKSQKQVIDTFKGWKEAGVSMSFTYPFQSDEIVLPIIKMEQNNLKNWLGEVALKGGVVSAKVGNEVASILNDAGPSIEFKFQGDRLYYGIGFKEVGIQRWIAEAVSLIIHGEFGLTNRLGMCKWKKCGRFRLDFSGIPRFYCNEEHRKKYDRDDAKNRMAAFRERKRKSSSRFLGHPPFKGNCKQ